MINQHFSDPIVISHFVITAGLTSPISCVIAEHTPPGPQSLKEGIIYVG